jgi:hypothetical protein
MEGKLKTTHNTIISIILKQVIRCLPIQILSYELCDIYKSLTCLNQRDAQNHVIIRKHRKLFRTWSNLKQTISHIFDSK